MRHQRCVLRVGHGGAHLFVTTASEVRLPQDCPAQPVTVGKKVLVFPTLDRQQLDADFDAATREQ
jgi:hypothetical protein